MIAVVAARLEDFPEALVIRNIVANQIGCSHVDASPGHERHILINLTCQIAGQNPKFLKEHRKVQEQQKQIEKLTAQLKEQGEQIRKVSDKVEMRRPAPQMVGNNQ